MRFICGPRGCGRLFASKLVLKGPLAKGEQFLTLDEEYINKFDEVVIIGDIHGCYDEFKELLDKVHAETPSKKPNRCLKIIVGDLVNKGPSSEKVLKLCVDKYSNSILAVRGNHDEFVLDQYNRYSSGQKLDLKNKWIESLAPKFAKYLNILPYSIHIPSLKCIIVHGGINPSLEEPHKTTPTQQMVSMRHIVVEKHPKTGEPSYRCTKSDEEGIGWANFWPGPEHVYFGHDAKKRLQDQHEFATGLDTGCVYGDRLSYIYVKGARKGSIAHVKAKKVYVPIVEG